MKRQISRTEFEDALRGSFAADMPEPATPVTTVSTPVGSCLLPEWS